MEIACRDNPCPLEITIITMTLHVKPSSSTDDTSAILLDEGRTSRKALAAIKDAMSEFVAVPQRMTIATNETLGSLFFTLTAT